MKLHISNKDLSLFSAGLTEGKKKALVEKHLAECGACMEKAMKISSGLRPLYRGSVPSAMLLDRIIETFRNRSQASTASVYPRILWRGAAAFACAAILFALYLLVKPAGISDVEISASLLAGSSEVNGKQFSGMSQLRTGDAISAGPEGIAEISVENVFNVKLDSGTCLKVEKSVKSGGRYEFRFYLSDGRVLADFSEGLDMEYSFATRDGIIESSGTVFMIDVTSEKTLLSVKSGKLFVSGKASQERLPAVEGNRYIIDSMMKSEKSGPSDFTLGSKRQSDTGDARLSKGADRGIRRENGLIHGEKRGDLAAIKEEGAGKSDDDGRKQNDADFKKERKEMKKEMRERRKEEKRERRERGGR